MKYIIEFEDKPFMHEDGMKFYKCIQAPWYYQSDLIIKRLVPYQPERKPGRWKEHIFEGIMGGRPRALMCNQCNSLSLHATNFCPNFGADMREANNADKNQI